MERAALEARREALRKQADEARAALLRLQGAMAILDEIIAALAAQEGTE